MKRDKAWFVLEGKTTPVARQVVTDEEAALLILSGRYKAHRWHYLSSNSTEAKLYHGYLEEV